MKIFLTIIPWLLLFVIVQGQELCPPDVSCGFIPRFAEYGNLPWSDERALLDELASQLRKSPDHVIYLLVYSGWRGCASEGKARGVRAKSYLMKHHGIAPDRVTWRDGGLHSSLSVDVWLMRRGESLPEPTPTVDRTNGRFKNCRHKLPTGRGKGQAAHNDGLQRTRR